MATAAVVGTFVVGAREPALRQTLCGLPRAGGTALGVMLPAGRPGVEERNVSPDGAMGGHPQLSCVISVDGHAMVRVLMSGQDPDRPSGTDATAPSVGGLVERGVVAGLGSASVAGFCPGTRDLATVVSVRSDPSIWPKAPTDQDNHIRALASLAQTVLAEQQHTVCQ
ncbi:hypothetical protein OG535_06390 [Kitasatospora sp. NBC_00085]|uniref:hypothetical protein n=1 Tax=unclassified Kitasatospora TaxID=2633591 RepID=UPI00324A51CB